MRIKTKRKALYELLKGIFAAARNGQKLPMCTILLLLHSTLHVLLSLETMHTTFSPIGNILRNISNHSSSTTILTIRQLSYAIIMLNFFINVVGYIFLIRLYKHSIRYIFNREIPPTIMECIPSFCAHLSLLRPLEIIFRYLTYRWRVLPDVIVLGEVRCGTTSLCQHFASLRQRKRNDNDNDDNSQQAETPIIDCRTPFCLWAHPELDHKETFFFVGHYLGYVTPEAYRMCFPLKTTKWFNEMKWKLMNYYYERMGKQSSTTIQQQPLFMTFDGCAQYLTSPTAAALIAEAYRAANQPPPILIACVREPIDQARSWWRYENNAMVWGDSMSLTKYNKDLRGDHYPPVTSDDALRFSLNSTTTTKLYKRAEYLFSQDNNSNKLEQATKRCVSVTIPYWAMTWPGGQLSGIGRNALFVENIMRYEKTFQLVFSSSRNNNNNNVTQQQQQQQQQQQEQQQQQQKENYENEKKLVYVNIMPMKYLSNDTLLKSFLFDILKKVSNRRARHKKKNIDPEFDSDLYRFIKNTITTGVHRNAAAATYSKEELFSKQSEDFFQVEKQKLLSLCQVNNITWI